MSSDQEVKVPNEKPVNPFNPQIFGYKNSRIMIDKVSEDISFLKDRIERIKNLQTPNSTVLKTYQSMLSARESVLLWLQETERNQNNAELSNFG